MKRRTDGVGDRVGVRHHTAFFPEDHPSGGWCANGAAVPWAESTAMDVRDEDDLEFLCTRRLDREAFPRVYIDATYVKACVAGRAVFEAIVAAVGATTEGQVEILGFDVGDSESRRFWERLLFVLRARGLRDVTEVLTSEDHGGLREALASVFPGADLRLLPDERLPKPISSVAGRAFPNPPFPAYTPPGPYLPRPPGAGRAARRQFPAVGRALDA